jgi:hypothetical protein
MNEPTMKVLARAAEASYTKDKTPSPDYERRNELSTDDISVYRHKVDPHHIIAHRGTDLHSDTVSKQLKADFNIALGNKSADKLHRERTKKTEEIVKKIKESDPTHTIHLTAHSLGGSTAQHAISKSKLVRDNVKSLDTFNSGSSLFGGKELNPNSRAYKEIARKSKHHYIKGDAISENVSKSMIGKTVKYENKSKPSIAQHILKMAKPLLDRSLIGKGIAFVGDKILSTLSSHSLRNFTK